MTEVLAVQLEGFQCLGVRRDDRFFWVNSEGRWVETWQQAIASAVSTGLFAQVLNGSRILFGSRNYVLEYNETYRQVG